MFYLVHLAAAAFRAISLRRLTPSFLARACPPLLPNWTAAWLLPSGFVADSSISLVVTSAERFRFFGFFAMPLSLSVQPHWPN
jgi:hypothetical protein